MSEGSEGEVQQKAAELSGRHIRESARGWDKGAVRAPDEMWSLDGRLKRGKKECGSKSKNNGGRTKEIKGRTQDRNKASKAREVRFRRRRTVRGGASGKRRRAGGDGEIS